MDIDFPPRRVALWHTETARGVSPRIEGQTKVPIQPLHIALPQAVDTQVIEIKGTRPRLSSDLLYGVAPAGWSLTDAAEPLVGTQWTVRHWLQSMS
jgi:hypothetical protein